MRRTWRWVGKAVLLAVHDREIAEHGGLDGIHDEGALESVLARPRNLDAYESPDGADLAACYAWGIARSHPFADGNKRVAWVTARVFLLDNRFSLKFFHEDAVRLMEAVAAGDCSESELSSWFRTRLRGRSRALTARR